MNQPVPASNHDLGPLAPALERGQENHARAQERAGGGARADDGIVPAAPHEAIGIAAGVEALYRHLVARRNGGRSDRLETLG